MKAPPKVLRHRQHQRRTSGHTPDHALDLAIAAHQRRHMARFNMFGIDRGAMLARHLTARSTNRTARRF